MSWRRVAAIYVVLAVLAGYWVLFERVGEERVPGSEPPPAAASLLEAEPEAVTAIVVRRGDREVAAVVSDGRWRTRPPATGENVPSDLLAALAGTLTAGQASEALIDASAADLVEFGLDRPETEIEVTLAGEPGTVRVQLGRPNPPRTAIYAQRTDRAVVYLVGLNLRYYSDLVLNAAE